MALLAFLVPVVTFLNGLPLVMFSIAYFFCISYSTISLYSYGISRDVERVEEAEKSEELRIKSEELLPAESLTRNTLVAEAVERWKASGEYRTHNLTLGIVAQQMGVPARHLQEWLRQSEYKKLAGMVAALRIEEAQRALREHPEWSVESVADYCGFNDRKYFHHVFQQQTGTTPSKYQQESDNL